MVIKYYTLMFLMIITLVGDTLSERNKSPILIFFLVLGIIISGYYSGNQGLVNAFGAIAVAISIVSMLFGMKAIVIDNVKFLCAIGALMGFSFIIKTMLYSAMACVSISMLLVTFQQNTLERVIHLFTFYKNCILTRTLTTYKFNDEEETFFPFSYAISAGVLIALIL